MSVGHRKCIDKINKPINAMCIYRKGRMNSFSRTLINATDSIWIHGFGYSITNFVKTLSMRTESDIMFIIIASQLLLNPQQPLTFPQSGNHEGPCWSHIYVMSRPPKWS